MRAAGLPRGGLHQAASGAEAAGEVSLEGGQGPQGQAALEIAQN